MKNLRTKKMVMIAFLSSLSYVLSSFIFIPNMAPMQHFINVVSAVLLGPGGALACATLTGCMRMLFNGRPIIAVTGAIFGALLAGLLYRKFKKLYWAVIGEVIGTGIIGAMVSIPFMKLFYGLPADTSPFFYISFFIPSSAVGAALGFLLLSALKKTNMLDKLTLPSFKKEKQL